MMAKTVRLRGKGKVIAPDGTEKAGFELESLVDPADLELLERMLRESEDRHGRNSFDPST